MFRLRVLRGKSMSAAVENILCESCKCCPVLIHKHKQCISWEINKMFGHSFAHHLSIWSPDSSSSNYTSRWKLKHASGRGNGGTGKFTVEFWKKYWARECTLHRTQQFVLKKTSVVLRMLTATSQCITYWQTGEIWVSILDVDGCTGWFYYLAPSKLASTCTPPKIFLVWYSYSLRQTRRFFIMGVPVWDWNVFLNWSLTGQHLTNSGGMPVKKKCQKLTH